MPKRKVVVIGAGKRVEQVIAPALWFLQDEFEIVHIVARTPRSKPFLGGRMVVSLVDRVAEELWRTVDMVILATPKESVGVALRTIPEEHRGRIVLLMDTPVISLRRLGLLRVLRSFKRVVVSEDYLGLPFFEAAAQLIREGKIGALRSVYFFHSGYRYHALAAVKRLSGSSVFSYIRIRHGETTEWDIRTSSGVSARILEPRDYKNGRTLIAGEKGTIGDYPLESQGHIFLDVHKGSTILLAGIPIGNDPSIDSCIEKYGIDAMPSEAILAAKVYGFIRLVQASLLPTSPYHYAPIEGIYDQVACAAGERWGRFLDVQIGKTSLIKVAIRVLSTVLP
ncbi:hypothetical protein D4R49_01105 [bacterium]|nr:MAG: hypothetical protein D4R49_01105 [bacterium]